MIDRKEFETVFIILYKKWRKYGKHISTYGIGWDIWQEQQKKIDDLQLKLAIKNDMITALNLTTDELKSENKELSEVIERCNGGECYQCDTESIPKNLMEQIKELEALNPDVPCPACGGGKHGFTDDGWTICDCCNETGTVHLTKAQEYRIEQLETEIERLDK